MLRYFLALALLCAPVSASAQDTEKPPPQDYLLEALLMLQHNHYRSDDADWDVLRAEAAEVFYAGGRNIPAAHAAIRHVIEGLGERHSYLATPDMVAADRAYALGQNSSESVESADDAGRTEPAPQPVPIWRAVNGGIGYVALPALNMNRGGSELAARYAAALTDGLSQLDEDASCGWIVDLRGNEGGNMWPMLAGLDPLLGEAPFGFFIQRGRELPWARTADGIATVQEVHAAIAPAFELRNADKPLAVVLSGRTSSSGEMVALALIGRDGVRTFGQPSGGYSTANSTYPLADGAMLVITVANAADRTGQVADGPLIPDSEHSYEQASFSAREWLLEECIKQG